MRNNLTKYFRIYLIDWSDPVARPMTIYHALVQLCPGGDLRTPEVSLAEVRYHCSKNFLAYHVT